MAWSDNFNRANGALGSDWDVYGTAAISGNQVSDAGAHCLVSASIGAPSGAHQATIVVTMSGNPGFTPGPVVKSDGSYPYHFYSAHLRSWYGTFTLYIEKDNLLGQNILAYTSVSDPGSTATISLTYSGGNLSATVNGGTPLTVSDSTYDSNTRLGFATVGNSYPVDDFSTTSITQIYLTIEPEEVWVANPVNFLQATIHGTDWSDVTDPGTGLTSSAGYVSSSFLETDTIQAFSWVPLLQTGTITITDPHTGATGTFTCTLYPPQNSGQSYPLTEDAAGILDRSGQACAEGHMLTTCDEVEEGSGVTILKALDGILEQLGGFYGQVGPDIGTVSIPSAIYELFAKQGESGYWTIPELIELLGGSPTVYSHADLKTAIDNISAGSNQDVLDALAAYFGANPPTVEQLGTMVSDLATIAGYDLGDVLDAIAAIPGTDLSPITDKLDLIQPSTAADLTTITNQLTTIDGNVDDLENSLAAVRTGANLTLQDILDAIDALTITAPPAPPVWPGLGNVTLGTPVALSDGLHIEAAMDGVIIAITTPPSKTGQRSFGGMIYYYGLGELAFETDDGDLEMWQYIGFTAMVATPKSMQHAGGVRIRMPAGGSGTITPWTAS